jgi:hypothetical protein
MVMKLWIIMAVGASCVAAGLGYAAAHASGAIGSAATTFLLIGLVGLAEFKKHRPQRAEHPARELARHVSRRFLLVAGVGSLLTVSTGIVWVVADHAPGGGVLIGAGLCLVLVPLALDRYLRFVQRSGRRY